MTMILMMIRMMMRP